MKTNREAGNCWTSLLEGEYCANAWVQNQMQKKLTLERFQREVRPSINMTTLCNEIDYTPHSHSINFCSYLFGRILDLTSAVQRFLGITLGVVQISPT